MPLIQALADKYEPVANNALEALVNTPLDMDAVIPFAEIYGFIPFAEIYGFIISKEIRDSIIEWQIKAGEPAIKKLTEKIQDKSILKEIKKSVGMIELLTEIAVGANDKNIFLKVTDALCNLLKSRELNLDFRKDVINKLEEIGKRCKPAVSFLIEQLQEKLIQWDIFAILFAMMEEQAIEPLKRIMKSDDDYQENVAVIIEEKMVIKDEQSINFIFGCLKGNESLLGMISARVLQQLVYKLLQDNDVSHILDIGDNAIVSLQNVFLDNTQSDELRYLALNMISKINNKKAHEFLSNIEEKMQIKDSKNIDFLLYCFNDNKSLFEIFSENILQQLIYKLLHKNDIKNILEIGENAIIPLKNIFLDNTQSYELRYLTIDIIFQINKKRALEVLFNHEPYLEDLSASTLSGRDTLNSKGGFNLNILFLIGRCGDMSVAEPIIHLLANSFMKYDGYSNGIKDNIRIAFEYYSEILLEIFVHEEEYDYEDPEYLHEKDEYYRLPYDQQEMVSYPRPRCIVTYNNSLQRVRQLCRIKTSVSSNILHKIIEAHKLPNEIINIVTEEFKQRANPSYDTSAYIAEGAWKNI